MAAGGMSQDEVPVGDPAAGGDPLTALALALWSEMSSGVVGINRALGRSRTR